VNTMIPLDDPTSLSLLFHLNSEPWLNDGAYKSAGGPQEYSTPAPVLAEVSLPPSPPTALSDLIRRRRSCRAFDGGHITADNVGSLLQAAYGRLEPDPNEKDGFTRRAVPSAGGLYPLEFYVFLRRVDDIGDGLYHYDVRRHALSLLSAGDLFPALQPVFYTYPFITEANVVIAMAAIFKRSQNKYGPRGYRYVLLEAGHAGQNICLRATELALATLCMGGFVDSMLNEMLGLAAPSEGVVYTLAAGISAFQSSG
jgi:SagB-type dehydrogenase family enzyme